MDRYPNIFEVIRSVSSRVEPYHSAFLGEMLRWSLSSDRRLFDALWLKATPGWPIPEGDITIRAEDVIPTGQAGRTARIDLTLRDGDSRILGIEVKTREASTTAGQLERYRKGLEEQYAGLEIAIAYLTPFTSQRAGDAASVLPSVVEFGNFAETFPNSRHLSWLDLAEVDWDGGELWEQHRAYVTSRIASEQQLKDWSEGGRSRVLSDFFGPKATAEFYTRLEAAGDTDGHILALASVQDPAALVGAFRALIESERVAGATGRADALDDASRARFRGAAAAPVHEALFALAGQSPNVWVQGRADYGLRVAHPNHPGGVSLATSRGVDHLEIGRPR